VINFREELTKGKKPFVFYQAKDKQKIKVSGSAHFCRQRLTAPSDAVGTSMAYFCLFLKDSC
jgi:hypothetical protein